MSKRVVHFFTVNQGEQGFATRCSESVPADKAEYVTDDEAQVTCATCLKRRPMGEAEVQAAEALVLAHTPEQVDERSVYVSYTQRRVGVRRRVDVKKVMANGRQAPPAESAEAAPAEAPDVDTSMLHLGKDIIDTSELAAIRQAQNAVYLWLYYKGYRSRIRPGFHVLPLALVEPFLGFIDKQEAVIADLVEQLVRRYPKIKAAARERLEPLGLYDEANYPSRDELRRAFRLEYSFPVGLDKLALVSADVLKREQERARARAEEEVKSIVAALRQQVYETVDHMAELLEPSDTGRAKGFRADSIDKAREFFDLFGPRNIGGDQRLEELVERAKGMLVSVTAEQLKSDADLRKRIQAGFSEVRSALKGMVELKPTRRAKAAQ